ncbi:hypothetical protein EVAR_99711_1 [Eumeta japonica]|uniref:Uncharacterized protein n=1 Tax=Eumeta variegata TaxID=151549 RepID=A0A4C1ZTU7_EUMVA|nr:hypothetical protein EVAR_99711_1 [Eumeta japonica]
MEPKKERGYAPDFTPALNSDNVSDDLAEARYEGSNDGARSAARGRPIIVEWERDARHSAGLSLVRMNSSAKSCNLSHGTDLQLDPRNTHMGISGIFRYIPYTRHTRQPRIQIGNIKPFRFQAAKSVSSPNREKKRDSQRKKEGEGDRARGKESEREKE